MAIVTFLREPGLWIALAAGLAIWALAYQAPYTHRLDLGGNVERQRRNDDAPFLNGTFFASEPADLPSDPGKPTYRWTRARSAITLPGMGGGRWVATIRARSGRPDMSSVSSSWDAGAGAIPLTIAAQPRVYQLLAQADRAGDLVLQFATPTFTTTNDPRPLGMLMELVEIAPDDGARPPAARQLALLAASIALIYGLLRRLALLPRAALVAALALTLIAGELLVRDRMALTLVMPVLPALLGGCYAFGVVLDTLYRRMYDLRFTIYDFPIQIGNRKSQIVNSRFSVVALVVLALALRLGGMLHPHAIFSDDGLNANNLLNFTTGTTYFTRDLPAESGGGPAPYPPGQYLVLAPTQLLLPADHEARVVLLKVGNALWESLAVGLLWYMLRRGGAGPRAALLGAALYVAPPPLLASLSKGEFANVFGQGLALPLLALLALTPRQLGRPRVLVATTVLAIIALLGHLGVTISLVCLLSALAIVWLIGLRQRRAVAGLLVAGAAAATLAGIFYYTAFADLLAARLAGTATASMPETPSSIGQKLAGQIGLLLILGIHPTLLAL